MRRGFTLIEALIAVGLGMTIALAAFACVRLAQQGVSTVNRLSTENRLLRLGVEAGLHELDFWTTFDDPSDPTRQRLRAPGNPFAALSFTGERHLDFRQDLPGSWWRGSPTTNHVGNVLHYGQPGGFSRVDYADGPDPAHDQAMRRQHILLRDIAADLGFVAAFDVLPANTIYSWLGADGLVPAGFRDYVCAPGHLSRCTGGGWGMAEDVPGDFARTRNSLYVITADPALVAAQASRHRFNLWGPAWNDADWGWSAYANRQLDRISLLPSLPTHWPALEVNVRHLITNKRYLHTATVTVTSPVTSESFKLFLATTATTLRGARRQRFADQ